MDLVVDRVPDVDVPQSAAGGGRVHSLREIAANKLCALVGRAEIRDLIDLRAILAAGVDLTTALADARRKDAGAEGATLAWLLDGLHIAPDVVLPGVTAAELDAFRRDLVKRLRALSLPGD